MVDNSNMPHPKCLGSQKNPGTEPKTCEKGPKLGFEYLPTSKTCALRAHCVHGIPCVDFQHVHRRSSSVITKSIAVKVKACQHHVDFQHMYQGSCSVNTNAIVTEVKACQRRVDFQHLR